MARAAWRAGSAGEAASCGADAGENRAHSSASRGRCGGGARTGGGGSDEDAKRNSFTEKRQGRKNSGERRRSSEPWRRSGVGGLVFSGRSFKVWVRSRFL